MYIYVYFIIIVLLYYNFMYSNNLEGRQGSDLIQYSTPWEYELTNKQTNEFLKNFKWKMFLLIYCLYKKKNIFFFFLCIRSLISI